MTQVSFKTTRQEMDLISEIADRAEKLGMIAGGYTRQTCVMDLCACHANGCPLDLRSLAKGPEFDFVHDIAGIARHIDRNTGKLKDHFLPRFARKTHEH